MKLEELLEVTGRRLTNMREDYGRIECELLKLNPDLNYPLRDISWLDSKPFAPPKDLPITRNPYTITKKEYLEALKLVLVRCIDNRKIDLVEASFLKSVHYPEFEKYDWKYFPPRIIPNLAVKVILGKTISTDPDLLMLRENYTSYRALLK